MKRRILIKWSAIIAVSALAIVLILAPRGRAPDLRKVGKLFPMPRGYAVYYSPKHLWISEREQVLFTHYRLPVSGAPFRYGTSAMALDMETGHLRVLQTLSGLLPIGGKRGDPVMLQSWEPSPNGGWMALQLYDGTNKHLSYGFVRMDGSGEKRYVAGKYAVDMQWNPVDGDLLVSRTDIRNGKVLPPNLLSYNPENPVKPRILPNHSNGSGLGLGVTSQGKLLGLEELQWPSQKTDVPIHLSETDPQAPNGGTKKWTIQPPSGKVGSISLSSRGDRLAWLINTHNSGPKIPFLRRLLQSAGYKPSDTITLCISKLDGSDMRTIGVLDVPQNVSTGSLAWSLSDKKISFGLIGSGLWVVPVQ
jgi:hypothetical protein